MEEVLQELSSLICSKLVRTFNSYLSHRIIDSFPQILKWKIIRLNKLCKPCIRGKLSIIRCYTWIFLLCLDYWMADLWSLCDRPSEDGCSCGCGCGCRALKYKLALKHQFSEIKVFYKKTIISRFHICSKSPCIYSSHNFLLLWMLTPLLFVSLFFSMASKPIDIRWIRTGSKT